MLKITWNVENIDQKNLQILMVLHLTGVNILQIAERVYRKLKISKEFQKIIPLIQPLKVILEEIQTN